MAIESSYMSHDKQRAISGSSSAAMEVAWLTVALSPHVNKSLSYALSNGLNFHVIFI